MKRKGLTGRGPVLYITYYLVPYYITLSLLSVHKLFFTARHAYSSQSQFATASVSNKRLLLNFFINSFVRRNGPNSSRYPGKRTSWWEFHFSCSFRSQNSNASSSPGKFLHTELSALSSDFTVVRVWNRSVVEGEDVLPLDNLDGQHLRLGFINTWEHWIHWKQ